MPLLLENKFRKFFFCSYKLYKKYVPGSYKKQYDKAKQTYFRVSKTSFTTITTNVNFQTTIHTDKGDDAEGFGNLVVIESGKYNGGETCFPQYGIGINVRTYNLLSGPGGSVVGPGGSVVKASARHARPCGFESR